MQNLLNDNIFPSFLTSVEVENLNKEIILAECYHLQDFHPGVQKSNFNGWHSKLFTENCGFETLNNLYKEAWKIADEVIRFHKLNQVIKSITWWVNINPEHSYNMIHSHPKADISMVYYAKVNKESGVLQLLRNDGSFHTSLYAKTPHMLKYSVQPVEGRMYAFPAHLLHQVLNNVSKEDRVSIAFNVTLE
jgi:uncharacterized protein (TIGR02466 family)